MHYDGGKHQTRILEQNIHNLVYGRFEITNEYGFPNMYPVHIDNLQDIPLQGFNYALKEKHPENIGVHFFLHDYQFFMQMNGGVSNIYTELISSSLLIYSEL